MIVTLLRSELGAAEGARDTLTSELQEAQQDKESAAASAQQAVAEASSLRSELREAEQEKESARASAQQARERAVAEASSLRSELREAEQEKKSATASAQQAVAEASSLRSELLEAEQEKESARASAQQARERAEAEASSLRSELQEAQRENERAPADESTLREELLVTEQRGAARIAELEQELHKEKLFRYFYQSMTNTYRGLFFEVLDFNFHVVTPTAAQEQELSRLQQLPEVRACSAAYRNRRFVFHSAPGTVTTTICNDGLRPSHCLVCRGHVVGGGACRDAGWFGDHTKGVYVSKHADYTMYYAQPGGRDPVAGDEGTIIMFETILGPTHQMTRVDVGVRPDQNHWCHESTNHLEYFMYDDETQAEPPRACKRLKPVAIIRWRAVQSRGHIKYDGA